MTRVDLLIYNIGQLATCESSTVPRRGQSMNHVGLISNAAVAIKDKKIVAVGSGPAVRENFAGIDNFDAAGRAMVPGFVDPHTHTVFGGDRVHEFEMRIQGSI